MAKEVFTIVERCMACKACEIACAVEHSAAKTLFGALLESPRSRPRVRVQRAMAFSYPARCMHCEDAPCILACPTGAMQRHPVTDSVFVDEDRCIGCWMCVMVCPFGAVTADPTYKRALKCDRCPERVEAGREPACVEACPTHALVFASPEEMAAMRREPIAQQVAAAVTATEGLSTLRLWRSLRSSA
ncbi:MAG TPA: 4Fe-4S dicluster domain-containing protein [Chromatiales bacterium]|nr:4Fe-4S dicluster domain-containing protein [Chromatiales bacterium]